jgi:hypothetical protein
MWITRFVVQYMPEARMDIGSNPTSILSMISIIGGQWCTTGKLCDDLVAYFFLLSTMAKKTRSKRDQTARRHEI